MLVWRRDDRDPRGEGVGQRPRGDLLGVPIRRDEDVAGRQPGRELGVVDVAIHEVDPTLQPEPGSLRRELLAVGLAGPPADLRVGRPDDRVARLRHVRIDPGERVDDEPEPLVRSEQAEAEDERTVAHANTSLGQRRIQGHKVRHPMRDDFHPVDRDAVALDEDRPAALGHRHEPRGSLREPLQDPPLEQGRVGENGVEGRDDRDRQRIEEVQEVRAARAAEDPVLVLDADDLHPVGLEPGGEAAILGPVARRQAVADDRRVREPLAAALEGDDAESAVRPAVGSQPLHEVAGERGDPALPWNVCRQERDRWKSRTECQVVADRRAHVAPPITRTSYTQVQERHLVRDRADRGGPQVICLATRSWCQGLRAGVGVTV